MIKTWLANQAQMILMRNLRFVKNENLKWTYALLKRP